jgi:prephenate dehydratase
MSEGGGVIAYQGEPGAFSHEACLAFFPDYEPRACATFQAAVDAVERRMADLALLPVENSIAGPVPEMEAILRATGLKVLGERTWPIRLQLLGVPGAELEHVRVVRSHPMALKQCTRLLADLGAKAEPVHDTAGAARALSQAPDPHVAAVASAKAGQLYGLQVLRANIEDVHSNATRFVVLAREQAPA